MDDTGVERERESESERARARESESEIERVGRKHWREAGVRGPFVERHKVSYALTPNAVEPIPTLGALAPPRRARPVPGPHTRTAPPHHCSGTMQPSGWLRASALTCRLISLVGVK